MNGALARIPYPVIDVEVESTDPTDGRMPPHDLDAEAATLAAVILDPAKLTLVDAFLRPEHFWSEAHRWIFAACLGAKAEGVELDIVSVANWLKRHDRISQVGGVAYVTELLNATPVVANVQHHARAVFDAFRLRRTIETCQRVAAEGYVRPGNAQDFIDGATRALTEIGRMNLRNPAVTNAEAVRRVVSEISRIAAQRAAGTAPATTTGIPTGLEVYDALVGGIRPGEKHTIVARPGLGKTAFASQVAVGAARAGIGVLFFEDELERDELTSRNLSFLASVDGSRIKNATLSQDDWRRVTIAANEYAKLPIRFDVRPGMNVGYIRAQAFAALDSFRLEHGVPLGLIVVDYVQRLEPIPGMERAELHTRVAHATKQLKILAQELKVPVLELAQPKRIDKSKGWKAPDLDDIAESAVIGREADRVTFIHTRKGGDGIDLYVVKNRGGVLGRVPVKFQGEFQRFVSDGEYRE